MTFKENQSPNLIFRILICDPESLVRNSMKRLFARIFSENDSKLEIHMAENGFECLNCIYQLYKSNKFFDLLIIDEKMPLVKGSLLINLLKTIINDGNMDNIFIVSHTPFTTNEEIQYFHSQGADFVLNKPTSYEELKNFLTKNLLEIS
jgi:CheY-like chemotaxis protein